MNIEINSKKSVIDKDKKALKKGLFLWLSKIINSSINHVFGMKLGWLQA